ncbi:WD repeat-containing protein 26 [Sesamum angolense]|uniref:WD repeat-containing protein 26 n=1 Tax=Sesamum angolense TaxID=2727404 RepID=A0AAE1VUQ9_9LAMI|nr:WD repeat-containing protein 26 [Sesamum angolense]
MGGVEDDEPPSKRVKVSSGESGDLSNGLSVSEEGSCSLSDSMARLPASQEDDEVVGSRGVIKKVELVRIIAEALYSLGYSKTGARLEEESGIPLRSTLIDSFMQQILDEQKFFELLDGDKVMDALKTLRIEIAPLCINDDRVRELSYFIVSPSVNLLEGTSGQESRIKSRKSLLEELQKLLPPAVMIPKNRLVHLVEQALGFQTDACRFHNSSVGEMSLLTDHQCGRDQIPCQTLQILREHSDEVWFLEFSHNGKFLASSSGDCLVIIWEVKVDGQVSMKHKLSGHLKPVNYVSWSPDDLELLTCGVEETVRRWNVASGECLHVYEKSGFGLVSCGWAPDGKSIFSGVTDKSISMWDQDGKEIECWKGQKTSRIADLEDQTIISFALSEDRKFLLISLSNEELHLWNIDGSAKLVAKYKGHKRSRFVVRSCFGGLSQAFIASGSEDSQVYIWHRLSGELILTLAGHSGAVNCVSWNPTNPHMLASASDDRTIRIWGLSRVNMNFNGRHSTGVHCCNGKT